MRLLLLVLLLASAPADEVRLVTGEVFTGEIISPEGAPEVRLRIVLGGMTAERGFPAAQVAQVVRGASPRTQALAGLRTEIAALGDGGDAAAWTSLAQRAQSLGDAALARSCAQAAVVRDRGAAAAQRLLGRETVHGVWMRPHEAATARGLVWHDGRWMPWAEREQALAEARRRHDEALAAAKALADRRPQPERTPPAYLGEIRIHPETPLQMIYWGAWPGLQPRPCPVPYDPILSVRGSGRWGGIDWDFRWVW